MFRLVVIIDIIFFKEGRNKALEVSLKMKTYFGLLGIYQRLFFVFSSFTFCLDTKSNPA